MRIFNTNPTEKLENMDPFSKFIISLSTSIFNTNHTPTLTSSTSTETSTETSTPTSTETFENSGSNIDISRSLTIVAENQDNWMNIKGQVFYNNDLWYDDIKGQIINNNDLGCDNV